MAIIQQPDVISMSGNMKKFIVSSGGQISFKLSDGATVLLDATYEPGVDGRATIDVRDIVENRLSYLISHLDFYEQTSIVKSFTATIDGVLLTFKVIRTGVANLSDTPSNWLRGNFLTWQPTNKQVTYYSPEWLTYYAQEACNIMLKATFPDNTVQNINLGACGAGKAFTCNLQYAVISGLLGQVYPSCYDVWVESASGTRLTYVQRYLYSETRSEQEQWFMFENSLGGFDTVRAYGDTDFMGNHQHKISTANDVSSEYQIDTNRTYNKNTGYLDEYERRWMLDFFPSRRKYVYHQSSLRPIVVSESDVKYSASDLPSSYNFIYHFTVDNEAALLNLVRNQEDIPASITIPDIDSPDFSLPPRLSEYPRVSLHEGVIIPAFDPHSPDPKVTSVGALIAAAVFEVFQKIESGEGGGELVDILRVSSAVDPSDYNVFSAARTLIEIATAIQEKGAEYFLSKTNPDTAKEVITFLKGINVKGSARLEGGLTADQHSEFNEDVAFGNYITGLLGEGAKIYKSGHGEFDSLFIRKWLEVPEQRYNRASVYTGIRWDTFGAGIIESVVIDKDVNGNDLNTGVITLKLEDGEYGAISEDDLCQGIFHNFTGANDTVSEDQRNGNFRFKGFNTVYFRVIEILDTSNNGVFRYQLRPESDNWYQQHHPQAFMHFAAYSNPSNTSRQSCVYTTTEYTIRLDNMTSWEYGEANIYGISGKLEGFKMGETIFHGHGNVIGNAYIYGHLQGIEEIIREQIQVGGKNLLREHALQFAGKYWGGDAEWKDIDIDILINILAAENDKIVVTENNLLIEY